MAVHLSLLGKLLRNAHPISTSKPHTLCLPCLRHPARGKHGWQLCFTAYDRHNLAIDIKHVFATVPSTPVRVAYLAYTLEDHDRRDVVLNHAVTMIDVASLQAHLNDAHRMYATKLADGWLPVVAVTDQYGTDVDGLPREHQH